MSEGGNANRVIHDRGDRTRPGRFHSRYWHLVLLYKKLREIVESEQLPTGETVLDYGCGNKPYQSLFERKFSRYLAADLPGNVDANVAINPQGRLPLDDGSVDCVLSSQVLEHVDDPRSYLAEAHRVLKPGGTLILSTHGLWEYHPDPTDYWRWTLDGLELEIRRKGFDIEMTRGVFGLASGSLQLWQDATNKVVPGVIRPIYIWLVQFMIGLIERRKPDHTSKNASVYIVLARKTAVSHDSN